MRDAARAFDRSWPADNPQFKRWWSEPPPLKRRRQGRHPLASKPFGTGNNSEPINTLPDPARQLPRWHTSGSVEAAIAEILVRWDGLARLTQNGDQFTLSSWDGEQLYADDNLPGLLEYMQAWDALLAAEALAGQGIKQASPINSPRRGRPEDPAVQRRRDRLVELVRGLKPATVRQVFYAASVEGLIDKTEEGYRKVQNDLVLLRRCGRLPYGWLADSTRWQRKPRTSSSIEQALEDTAELYRKSLWQDASEYVEIWLEKDALAGVIYPVTARYDVPLMVARGYASLSFLHSAAEFIAEIDKPACIYHLGDYDPSGQDAARATEQTLRELAPDASIYFERIAVTPEQIEAWNLPSRPTKKTDTRAAKFGSDISVELDAIPPDRLRDLVEVSINQHLPQDQLAVLLEAEKSERAILHDLVGKLQRGDDA